MKKKKKKGIILKVALITLAVAGAGFLVYKKVPQVKAFVDSKINPKTTEIKTKPFRKYETYKKK